MVKSYLRYSEDAQPSWGVVVSGGGQIASDATGKLALAPALECVHVWSIKQGAVVRTLRPAGARAEVTALAVGADGETVAVGHSDGAVRLWALSDGTERVTLSGHRSAVNALRFSADTALLLSGGSDTHIVVWDVVAEAGNCRLRGHRDAVGDVALLEDASAAASVSKDGTLKLWDVTTQHCVQTTMAPSGELWSVDACGELMLTGGAAGELLLWSLQRRLLAPQGAATPDAASSAAPQMTVLQATLLASIPTQSSARVARVRFSVDGRTVGVQFANRSLQLFGVRDEEQLRKRHKRKDTRLKRRAEAADGEAAPSVELTGEETAAAVEEAAAAEAAAQLQPLSGLRASHKLHSFSFLPGAARGGGGANVRVLAAQRDNSFGVWECELAPHGAATETARVAAAGHRAEPRAIALSADDRYVLSAGDGEAKVWAVGSRQCVRSMASGFALCATFVLGGRYALVGTKAGALQLFSMATGECVHEVEAHGGAVWALALEPGSRGALSASADKRLVAWTIEDATESGEARLSLQREHTLPDDAMCAGYSADAKYVAAGLLDASVLILFHDTFKLYLTLYGHKLPVLALSLSSDGALVATGSADKTLKLWGLDFGDCHRSLLAHSEAVTAVQFVRNTHYVFTCGKDKLVKYWDADTFELILTLPAHHDAVWGVAVSRDGGFITSVGRDRSLRLWRRTEEQVFLEEEREAETDALLEAGLEKQQHTAEAEEEEAAALGLEGAADAAAAGRRTLETVKGAERILEALRVLDDEADRVAEHVQAVELNEARGKAPPVLVPNMLLLGLDAGGYLLKALTSVRAAELEQALLLLPFDAVRRLLERLLPLLPTAPHIELLARSILYTLRVHHKQVIGSHVMLQLLHQLDSKLRDRLQRERGVVGYNLAAMRHVQKAIEQQSDARAFFDEAVQTRAGRSQSSTAELRRRTAAREGGRRRRAT